MRLCHPGSAVEPKDSQAGLARFTRIYQPGTVIFREGEPGDRMYFVLEGSVRITRSTLQDSGRRCKNENSAPQEAGSESGRITLATMSAGEFFGEMAVFTGQSRSGTAEAVTKVSLLALNREETMAVIKARPELAMRLIESLCQRLAATDACLVQEKAGNVAGDEGIVRSGPQVWAATLSGPVGGEEVAGVLDMTGGAARSAADHAVLPDARERGAGASGPVAGQGQSGTEAGNGGERKYRLVETTCPVCRFKFQVPWVSSREFHIGQRDGDLRPHYEGEHGLYHAIWVCPRCRYAAYRDSFTKVTGEELEQLRKMLDPDFRVDPLAVRAAAALPDLEEAIARHKLALSAYQVRKSHASVVAGLYHQLAWLYREAGDEEQEKRYLALALEKYVETFEKGKGKFPAQLGEPGVLYLAGEINRRLGNYREAARWLEKAIRHPEIKQHPLVSELARDRWVEVREGLHGE